MLISKYEIHIRTNMRLDEIMDKFKQMGYSVKYKLMKKHGLIKLISNGEEIDVYFYNRGMKNGLYDYELGTKNKNDFMKLYDMLNSTVDKYEFHIQVPENVYTDDIIKKIETMGYKVKYEQTEDGELRLHIMNGGYIDAYMKKYTKENDDYEDMEKDYDEYEICANSKDDFMKLHDMFSRMMM